VVNSAPFLIGVKKLSLSSFQRRRRELATQKPKEEPKKETPKKKTKSEKK
jgi:hypothetical protein